MDNKFISFETLKINELESISGGVGSLAYDLGHFVGKNFKDLYYYRRGIHISTSGKIHGGMGRSF